MSVFLCVCVLVVVTECVAWDSVLFLSTQLKENVYRSITHDVDHVIQLLEVMTRGSSDQLASVFLDCVAPHSQPSVWPPEDSQKYSLEW